MHHGSRVAWAVAVVLWLMTGAGAAWLPLRLLVLGTDLSAAATLTASQVSAAAREKRVTAVALRALADAIRRIR